ncbi:ABC transporter substrate-binding protein [Variovorax sp. PBL-E5]|uniref:ABC transporter substrate-binding protein n=1 Tax=Variovorax sp. PBL-E5 TaxID=434014 RepID=UPI001316853A|nr:ABC transporter substrate-binding protein [Variovorax sp. PBL-E5]VTU45646.1 putative D,D-dipeptide-binding periplasmic protein DdpA precursor [Variovorax sp. PBL-E5]
MQESRRDFVGQSAGLLFSLTALAPAWAQPAARQGGTVTLASQTMRTLNSAIQSGNATGVPATQIFAGLVQLDSRFKPQPYLARSWEVSPDGLVVRFKLVEGATFHDGRPIRARDVAFSIETVKASHPLMSVTYSAVLESVRAVDDLTVEIRLKHPFQGLFGVLTPALTPIIPEHVYGPANGPIQTNPANAKPVGSGPFRFVEWKAGEYVILERNPHFFRPNRPYLERVVLKIAEDSLSRRLMLERGDIDYLPFSFLRIPDMVSLRSNPNMVTVRSGYEALGPVAYLEMNLRQAPLNDLRVRQAIAHAIDKDFIVKTLHHKLSKRLDGPLHSGNEYFDAKAVTVYPTDLAKANALLDAAGHLRKAEGTRFALTLDIPTFDPDSMSLVAEYLRSQLRRVGIDITLRMSTDLADWSNKVGQWNYQLTMNSTWNWSDPLVGVHRSFLSSNIKKVAWSNTGGYSNPKVDDLLDRAAVEPDPGRRRALYADFQKTVTADLPLIWTNESIYVTFHHKRVKNVPNGVFGALAPFDEIVVA